MAIFQGVPQLQAGGYYGAEIPFGRLVRLPRIEAIPIIVFRFVQIDPHLGGELPCQWKFIAPKKIELSTMLNVFAQSLSFQTALTIIVLVEVLYGTPMVLVPVEFPSQGKTPLEQLPVEHRSGTESI